MNNCVWGEGGGGAATRPPKLSRVQSLDGGAAGPSGCMPVGSGPPVHPQKPRSQREDE